MSQLWFRYNGLTYRNVEEVIKTRELDEELYKQKILRGYSESGSLYFCEIYKEIKRARKTHGTYKIRGKVFKTKKEAISFYDKDENFEGNGYFDLDEVIELNLGHKIIKNNKNEAQKQLYIVQDKIFKSAKEVGEYYNIRSETFKKLVNSGMESEEAIKKCIDNKENSIRCNVFGEEFNSINSVAKRYNVKYEGLRRRVHRNNISVEDALKCMITPEDSIKSVKVFGVSYKNLDSIYKRYGIKGVNVSYRMKAYEETLEEAILKVLIKKYHGEQIGENTYIITCQECGRRIFVSEEELVKFKHNDKFCEQREVE